MEWSYGDQGTVVQSTKFMIPAASRMVNARTACGKQRNAPM